VLVSDKSDRWLVGSGHQNACILPASSRKQTSLCALQPLRTCRPSEQSGQDARGPRGQPPYYFGKGPL